MLLPSVVPIFALRSGVAFNLFETLVLGPAEDIVRIIMSLFGL